MIDIGFIGTGNMGGALIQGYANSAAKDRIHIYDKDPAQAEQFSELTGVKAETTLEDLVRNSQIIILAVKPNIFEILLPDIKKIMDTLTDEDEKVFVSIAAGISINYMKSILGQNVKTIRTMPNLNSMVGQGMTAISRDDLVGATDCAQVKKIFDTVGKSAEVKEEMIDTVIGISGSSPAYAFMYMNALIKCAEKNGMNKEDAIVFATQATLGAAVTIMESGIDPETLTENVCSPGGTTIEAVNTLKGFNFEGIIDSAMRAAIEKSKKMTK